MENTAGLEVKEDLRQSVEYGRYMERIGWKVTRIQSKQKIQIFIRKLGLVGIAKIQRVKLPLPWKKIEEVLRRERAFTCKLEPIIPPGSPFGHPGGDWKGFKQDGWPLLGTKTQRVNLRPSEKDIFESFKKDARYVLRKLQDARYKIQINKFEDFYETWRKSARRKNLWIPKQKDYRALVDCFGKKCFCITAGELAGALILTHRGTAYYYYAGATKTGNEQNLPYLAVWEAMKESKGRGCRVWDWEGIYDARWPNKGWRGFSHFKKSFGGREVEYPGCFNRWQWPW